MRSLSRMPAPWIRLMASALLLGTVFTAASCGDDDESNPTGTTPTDVVLEFNFENFSSGQLVGSHSNAVAGITGVWEAPNNGVETWGSRKVSVVRNFGEVNGHMTAPVLTLTLTKPMSIGRLEFEHFHNHNFSYTEAGYEVKVQFNAGSGFIDLGTCFADTASYGDGESIACPGALTAGTYSIRWVPTLPLPNGARNTGSDFFALDNVRLKLPQP